VAHFGVPPLVPVHEEEVAVHDVFDAVGEEVGEVIEVFDANLEKKLIQQN
jgi:hypothetical protein